MNSESKGRCLGNADPLNKVFKKNSAQHICPWPHEIWEKKKYPQAFLQHGDNALVKQSHGAAGQRSRYEWPTSPFEASWSHNQAHSLPPKSQPFSYNLGLTNVTALHFHTFSPDVFSLCSVYPSKDAGAVRRPDPNTLTRVPKSPESPVELLWCCSSHYFPLVSDSKAVCYSEALWRIRSVTVPPSLSWHICCLFGSIAGHWPNLEFHWLQFFCWRLSKNKGI